MVKYNTEDLTDHCGIAAVIKDNEGRVLIQKHVKYGFWTIPVGKGIDAEETLKTEIKEECGIKVKKWRLIARKTFTYNRRGKKVNVDSHLYEIDDYEGDIKNLEPHKHSKQVFMKTTEIKELKYKSDMLKLWLKIK